MKSKKRTSGIIFAMGILVLGFILLSVSGCTKEGPAGPRGETVSSNLMDPNVSPEIVSSAPASHTTGPYNLFAPGPNDNLPHFILEFNKLVNINALPLAVKVSGFRNPVAVIPNPYIIYRAGNGNTPESVNDGAFDNIFAFSIVDSSTVVLALYEIGKTYTVTVDTQLYDINNNHPVHATSFSFTPEPSFRLVAVSPTNGSTNVNRKTEPYIYFNAPINKSILNHLHLSPAISGIWSLYNYDIDSVTAIFTLLSPFAFHTQYTFTIDEGAADASGDVIHYSTPSTFTTATFSIAYAYPSNGSEMVDPNTQIQVAFSDPADTASAFTAFSISPGTPGFLYFYSTYFNFSPVGGLIPNTQYTITLSTALKSVEGFHLESPYTLKFTTAPFEITSTSPYDGANDVSRYSYCYMYSNMVIDTGSVRNAFHITPAVPGVLQVYSGAEDFEFIPSAALAPTTVYTVTIDSTLRSFNGYLMIAPYRFSFTTGTD